jgi:isoquinoline 1-oxidoreductase beta subunit
MTVANISRRNFIKTASVSAGGFMLGLNLPIPNEALAQVSGHLSANFNPNAFIHITNNGDTFIYCGRSEMGQGISTALTSAVADELEADWQRVTVKQADGDEKYGPQATGGSASIRTMFTPMREAGAAAKEMLIFAAAKVWQVATSDCFARNHYVINKINQQKLSYGELASLAANSPVPSKPKLKDKHEYNYIGKSLAQHNQTDILTGKLTYGVDTKISGLKYAAMIHCPVLGGRLKSVDDSQALTMKGVIEVIKIPRFNVPFGSIGGIAIVADNTWTAQQALKKLVIEWELGKNQTYNTKTYKEQLVKNVEKPAKVIFERGDLSGAFTQAKHVVKATYTGGHVSHSPMEPNASVVWVKDNSCEVWAPTQSPADIQKTLGQYLKRDPKDIIVHVTMLGGAFGRKFKCDYVHEAAVISEKIKAPVQLTWSREEDTRTGFYHSINAQRIEAAIDDKGNVSGWLHRAAFPPIASLFDPSVDRATAGDLGVIEEHPIAIKNLRSESGEAIAHTRIGWYRAVYALFYGFSFGTFIDELAYKAKVDTLSFTKKLYLHNKNEHQNEQVERSLKVLELASTKAGWENRSNLPSNQGLGIAVHFSFGSYVAMAVKVEVKNGDIKVLKVDCAIDCGQILNRDGATAQMEGAVVMAMSLSLRTEIVFKDGAVVNSNFHNYPVMRITDMPQVNVHIVENDHKPTGLGEPGLAPFPAALSNAVFVASGKRYRDLPFQPVEL